MNIHDHYEPDAPTHYEQPHGLFMIDVPLTYCERIDIAAQDGDIRAGFELWWHIIGRDVSVAPGNANDLARKAWLAALASPAMMDECISPFVQFEQDPKLMAWQCYAMANAVYIAECEIANARAGCDCRAIEPDPTDQTQRTAFEAAVEETPGFAAWWDKDGSGIPKCEWHDAEEHAHKVALFAYQAGMQQAKGGAE